VAVLTLEFMYHFDKSFGATKGSFPLSTQKFMKLKNKTFRFNKVQRLCFPEDNFSQKLSTSTLKIVSSTRTSAKMFVRFLRRYNISTRIYSYVLKNMILYLVLLKYHIDRHRLPRETSFPAEGKMKENEDLKNDSNLSTFLWMRLET
jgi:hypothetical protein